MDSTPRTEGIILLMWIREEVACSHAGGKGVVGHAGKLFGGECGDTYHLMEIIPPGGLLNPKLGINCVTDRESGSGQPIKVALMEGAVTPLLPFCSVYKILFLEGCNYII